MSKKAKQPAKSVCVRGFLPDFSKYLDKDFPIETAYTTNTFTDKLGNLLKALATTQNPAQDLQNNGLCKKLEKMNPNRDKALFDKVDFPQGPLYCAAFGDSPYRIVFGIDSNTRKVYFFALDTTPIIKVLTVFGTRPEAIKMAPVVKELAKHKEVNSIVCVTAQHREMLDQVLRAFRIKPDYDMNIMKQNQTLSSITADVLTDLEKIIAKVKPDIVLVHGDTTTAMATTLSAFYQQVAIGHVEAGLRTHDKYSPFPEEMNRQIIDCMADMLFAPTELSKKNLENLKNKNQEIFVTGNTAIDALSTTVSNAYTNPVLDWASNSRLILLTAHRRENLGEPMGRIFRAIKRVVNAAPDVKVVYPVHLNPKVQTIAKKILDDNPRIKLIEPLEVVDFHNFMEKSYIIMTDSGGIQEEAPSLGKPVLVLRDTTERPEGIEAGTLKLVGTDEENIFREAMKLLDDNNYYKTISGITNPYGDGHASERIANAIITKFSSFK